MNAGFLRLTGVALFAVAIASAQTTPRADSSANSTLKGDYFVREVLMTGGTTGAVTAASSVIGVATFDGNGGYTFSGKGTSIASGPNASLSFSGGTYSVGSNGFLRMQSLADRTDNDFGGFSSVGAAFVASATEQGNVTLLVGIQAGSNVTNSSFKGNYTAGAIDFPSAQINAVREATFNLTADGSGNLGNVTVTGVGADIGGTNTTQTASGVTYSLSGSGSGTLTFGAAANSQLVSGAKTFYLSSDGNIIMAGSPTGYDLMLGIRSLGGGGSNATASGEYFLGAIEDQVDPTGKKTIIDALYGSVNSTGTGTSLFHNRTQSLIFSVYDFTYDSQYTVASDGTISFGQGTPYEFIYGAGGKAFIGIGNATVSPPLYSLTLGLAMPNYSGSGVYLFPNGVVNSATFAPATNPIAPNELITLVGTGLASTPTSAPSLPLPTTLGGVQVMINGIAAPLDYVSPTQIIALVPSSISPNNNEFYATLQVINNNVSSNSVTVYTSNSSPGVFAINPVAIGPAAAEHANYTIINSTSPAAPSETITVFVGGLGSVTPAPVPDGAPAPSTTPLSKVNDPNVYVDFSGVNAPSPLPFVGLTPTTAGLYQINVQIPTGTSSNVYVDVGTTDGYTSQATLAISGGTAAAHAVTEATGVRKLRKGKAGTKTAGFAGRME